MSEMCQDCHYDKISHIKLLNYDMIVDICDTCDFCSLSFQNYYQLIRNISIFHKIGNLNVFRSLDDLSQKQLKQLNLFHSYFTVHEEQLKSSQKNCRICKSKLFQCKKTDEFSIFICRECMTVFFQKNLFYQYVNKCVKDVNKQLYFIKIYKRFLQFLKRGKNNVKK